MEIPVWLLCLCLWCEVAQTVTTPVTPTPPPDVTQVNVTSRSETHLQLEWDKVNNNNNYDYILRDSNGIETTITGSDAGTTVTHTVSSLSAGTNYSFTLYTVFEEVRSTGFQFSNVTTPPPVTQVNVVNRSETHLELEWDKVNNNNNYNYTLTNSLGAETTITAPDTGNTVTHTVSSLSPGTEYPFTLFTVFEGVISTGFNFSGVTTPPNVNQVNVTSRSQTHLELKWTKVNNNNKFKTYILRDSNGTETSITGPDIGLTVTHTVLSLSPGTKYSFTLFTVFEGVRSTGFNFSDVTTPSDVAQVNVVNRSETDLELEWTKVNNNHNHTYILTDSNETETNITAPDAGITVTHKVSSLSAGTNYNFTLYTVLERVRSPGLHFSNVTTINCAAGQWITTNSTIEGQVSGLFSMATAINGSDTDADAVNGNVVGNKTTFGDLCPGATYRVSLYYESDQEKLLQCSYSLNLYPTRVTSLRCSSGDYSIGLHWEEPFGVWSGVEVHVSGKGSDLVNGTELKVTGLQPAQTCSISVTSLSGTMRSSPVWISCQTQSVVIWVPVLVIILLGLLAVMGVFMYRGKSKLPKKEQMLMYKRQTEKDSSQNKFKAIPVNKFQEHFLQLSHDDNKEFTIEYMQFRSVGADLSQHDATLAENRSKNRFIDILPYDCSRVKLSTHGHNSDYINANYIPGYGGKNMDYIAAQGPLPSTVSDFWRMIWEQKSERIVMVTKCTENGRSKCAEYWPQGNAPCRYGELLITKTSEHEETDWTIREFTVKHEVKSEVRLVKHFHFTAWPDHGVPNGTKELIQFRGLIRNHIKSRPGPTVMHCSAGVGRTGTLIALDVLLQQLEKEEAVDIAGFVYRMRRHRPRMVQTESQYIYLHQCIKDYLGQKSGEPIYINVNNTGMTYENSSYSHELD